MCFPHICTKGKTLAHLGLFPDSSPPIRTILVEVESLESPDESAELPPAEDVNTALCTVTHKVVDEIEGLEDNAPAGRSQTKGLGDLADYEGERVIRIRVRSYK